MNQEYLVITKNINQVPTKFFLTHCIVINKTLLCTYIFCLPFMQLVLGYYYNEIPVAYSKINKCYML